MIQNYALLVLIGESRNVDEGIARAEYVGKVMPVEYFEKHGRAVNIPIKPSNGKIRLVDLIKQIDSFGIQDVLLYLGHVQGDLILLSELREHFKDGGIAKMFLSDDFWHIRGKEEEELQRQRKDAEACVAREQWERSGDQQFTT